jgi:hypothetical protein
MYSTMYLFIADGSFASQAIRIILDTVAFSEYNTSDQSSNTNNAVRPPPSIALPKPISRLPDLDQKTFPSMIPARDPKWKTGICSNGAGTVTLFPPA